MKKVCWTNWLPFPDPFEKNFLCAPIGAGVYELRIRRSRAEIPSEKPEKAKDEHFRQRKSLGPRLILFGESKNVAYRLSSLLSRENGGCGHRSNEEKRKYVGKHIKDIEYRTLACKDEKEAKEEERKLNKSKYLFST